MKLKKFAVPLAAVTVVAGGSLLFSAHAATSGGIITETSNGEAGWYTDSGTPLNEIHEVVDLPTGIESTGSNGGIGDQLGHYEGAKTLVSPGPGSTATTGDTCYVAQVGLKWDGTGYQVWTGVGELQFDPTATNPFEGGNGNACTQGGSLAADAAAGFGSPDETYAGGYDQVTVGAKEILGTGAGPGAQGTDLQPGQAVFLKLEIGTNSNGLHFGVVKGTAQALDYTVKADGNYSYSALTAQDFEHIVVPPSFGVYDGGYANVGTVFDNELRAVFPSGGGGTEARFDGVRAADGVHKVNGVVTDDDAVLGSYGQYGAESTSNGTAGGGIFVQPGPLAYSVFTVNVGNLVTAG
jgi:hypothetical protein